LYGFNLTKQAIRATGKVHIVEGYFDLISLYMNGVENVAATLGTAITRDHVRMLSRSGVKKFVLVFDSDEAGVKAAERSIPVFQKEFISAHVLVLPKPHDPDTYVREFGPDQFKKMSDGSLGVIPFLSEISIKKHGLSVEGRLNVIHDMTGPLSMVDDPIARSLYIRGLSGRIGVDEKAILEKVNDHVSARGASSSSNAGPDTRSMNGVVGRAGGEVRSVSFPVMERQIVSMMLQYSDIIEECRENRVSDYFESRELRDLCVNILNYTGNHADMASYFMIHANHEDERRLIASLAIGDIPYLYKNCVTLIRQFINTRKKTDDSLSRRIRDAEERNDHELLLKLIQEKNAYSKTLKNQIHIRKR
jgi:DNA primase